MIEIEYRTRQKAGTIVLITSVEIEKTKRRRKKMKHAYVDSFHFNMGELQLISQFTPNTTYVT